MVAEFESDLIRMRIGMKVAREKGRLRGKQLKLKPNQAKHLAELFGVGRSTIYRTLERMRPAPPEPEPPVRASTVEARLLRTSFNTIRLSRESPYSPPTSLRSEAPSTQTVASSISLEADCAVWDRL